jgi:hypothetical protein
LMAAGNLSTRTMLGASDAVGTRIEELQFDLGEGPCVSAFATGHPVLLGDLEAAEVTARWPVFTAGALATGARALFALPLQIGAINIGVLDLYRTRPGSLTQLSEALMIADAVAVALLNVRLGDIDGYGADGFDDQSWLSGREVHQATGMIASQLDTTMDAALARLRAYAYGHDRSVAGVAGDVVARRLRFTDEME